MHVDLTPEQTALQTRARRFARDHVAPVAGHLDAENLFPRELIAQAGRVQIIAAEGEDGLQRAALAAEALAEASATVALAVSVNALVALALARFGGPAFADRARQLEAGIAIGALALSAPPIRADASRLPAVIEANVLTGTKTWIANGEHADVALIVARDGQDNVTVLVDLRSGVARAGVGETAGARGLACANLTFPGVTIGEDARLRPRDGVSPGGWLIAAGRALNAAVAVGLGRAALDEALGAARARGAQLTQSVQFVLADMATELDAAWLLTLKAASAIDGGRAAEEASMAGVQAVEAARRATDAGMTVIGPAAMTSGARPEQLVRDARAIQWFMGTPDAQRSTVADAILG